MGTDVVGPKQLADAPANVRWAAWFVEKIGLTGGIIFILLWFGGNKLDEIGSKIDRLALAVEAMKK